MNKKRSFLLKLLIGYAICSRQHCWHFCWDWHVRVVVVTEATGLNHSESDGRSRRKSPESIVHNAQEEAASQSEIPEKTAVESEGNQSTISTSLQERQPSSGRQPHQRESVTYLQNATGKSDDKPREKAQRAKIYPWLEASRYIDRCIKKARGLTMP